MDRIREEFEKEWNIPKHISWDGNKYQTYYTGQGPQSVTRLFNERLTSYRDGHKSRDGEIKKITEAFNELKEELNDREQECIDYQKTILNFKDLKDGG